MDTVNMTRHYGSAGVALVELASKRQQHYIVRTDIKPEQSEDGNIVSFIETMFLYKPTMGEIKAFVYKVINEQIKSRIQSGFVWNDTHIWLSEENQRDWTQAVVPVTFKIGEDADNTPIYHTFYTEDEIKSFNNSWVTYIQECLAEGYTQKDGFDFTEYKRQLNNL